MGSDNNRSIWASSRRPRRIHQVLAVIALATGLAACGDSTVTSTPALTLTPTFTLTALTSTASITSTPTVTVTPTPADRPIAPLSSAGRWFTDAAGRVVMFHGMNMVQKTDPYYPAAYGFGDDDVAFLVEQGFNALRLGVDFRGLMPTPGIVEETYIDHLAETVDAASRHQMFVLLDFHQDGFSPMFNGNGLPDWMAITDGLPNPPNAVFPLYYIQNPAVQRAFEHFWANSPGPNGVGLQDYYLQGVERVVARFADNPLVLGVELMNEPFPGAQWQACALNAAGCPDLEQQRLEPFYQKGAAAARALAPRQLVFVEPFVLFNFGQAATSLPGTNPGVALAVHSYATSQTGEVGVVTHAVDAAQRDQAPLLLTEFGAVTDAVVLNRLTAEMEAGLVPWMFWAYEGEIINDRSQPAGPDNLRSPEAFDALVRPYPVALTGTPTAIAFDPDTNAFDLTYDTTGPGGVHYASDLVSVVFIPQRHYSTGYGVTVQGAIVISAPCASPLLLRNQPDAASVSVHVVPASGACEGLGGVQ